MEKGRFIGAILLVAGTAIGAGMLALPVITAFGGFFPSLLFLLISWFFLFTTAWILLDVNLSFKEEVNLITMAEKRLGIWGKMVCWITYLLLLYALTAAYIAGSSPLFLEALETFTFWKAPTWFGPLPLLAIFGLFVYLGTKAVDRVNRLLMFGLLVTYVCLIALLPEHLESSLLSHVDLKASWIALPLLITSYGFHIIIPTLTTYLKKDRIRLRWALFIGSLLPFFVYTVWELLVLGVVPIEGEEGLATAWQLGRSSTYSLSLVLKEASVSGFAKGFSFFAIITSFLGVSLSLSDFLTDGLKIKRFSFGRELSSFLTFFPPLLFVYAYPRGFILALQFAAIFVAILLCILPALMAWKLPLYKNGKRKLVLLSVIAFSLFIILLDFLEETGHLKQLILPYVQS